MKVTGVVAFHVRPGKTAELMERIKTVSRILEREGGATVKVNRQVFGPTPGIIAVVAEYPDWSGFAKVRMDKEFQQILEGFNNHPDPPAEMVIAGVFEEVPR
jgi:hypothetical protein